MTFDTLITNALLIDGLNGPARPAQVGIRSGRIAAIGTDLRTDDVGEMVDANGLYLVPGFIDPHASTGFGYFFPNAAGHKLFQGITTEIFGNCGTSPAPIGDGLVATMHRLSQEIGFPFEWRSTAEYFEAIAPRLQFNIATLVGHSTLRGGYMEDIKNPTAADWKRMKAALATAMQEGALGMSTGLIYAPGCFAGTEEIVALAKVCQQYGGLYASHIRNERDLLTEAVQEALDIGHAANIPILISHLKAAERPNWGKIPAVLRMLEAYNDSHEAKAHVDVYPYTAVSTKLRAFIPKFFLEDGMAALPQKMRQSAAVDSIANWIAQKGYDLEKMLVISNDIPDYHGKTIADIARQKGLSLAQSIATAIHDNPDTWVVYHCIEERDMDQAVLWDKAMICTDSWSYPINAPKVIGQPHPRSYGAFTTYLEHYVIRQKSLAWPEAIYKITHLPASVFGMRDRGSIQEGYHADLVLLNPDNIKANATYLNPKQLSEGVEYVWVNGVKTIEQGKLLPQALGGQVLRHEPTQSYA